MDKPQVPPDLWQQLAEAEQELIDARQPPGSFTVREYAEHASMSQRTAQTRLENLVRAGKVKKVGSWKNRNYYKMVDK